MFLLTRTCSWSTLTTLTTFKKAVMLMEEVLAPFRWQEEEVTEELAEEEEVFWWVRECGRSGSSWVLTMCPFGLSDILDTPDLWLAGEMKEES